MIPKKRKKERIKILSVKFALIAVMAVIMVSGIYAGGQSSSQTVGTSNTDYLNTASAMPITKNKITLNLVMEKGPTQGSADKIWFWKWAEQTMNIHFNVVQVESVTLREKINLMMASNELPDLFHSVSSFTTSDIFQYGQKEKQFIPLNSLIDNYAPNLSSFFKQYPSTRAQSTCPDGNIYTLPGVNFPPQTYNCPRPWINMGWLNKLGLQMPDTLDQFYNVLTAFRDKDPNGNGKQDEIPMIGGANNAMTNTFAIIAAAMGFPEPNPWDPVVVNN